MAQHPGSGKVRILRYLP